MLQKIKNSSHYIVSCFLISIGLFQMIADLTQQPKMKALGATWGASPAPKVFSSAEGLETFSSQFFFIWTDRKNVLHSFQLTPEIYRQLKGPYNRWNVYGAVLSYGPLLSKNETMREAYESVLTYAINGPLIKELGIEADTDAIAIEVVPRIGQESHLELIKTILLEKSDEQ